MQARVDWVLIIFGTQVIKKKRSVRPVFPDYLSVSYDYGKTKPQTSKQSPAGKKIRTAYIWDTQEELLHHKEKPIDRHQIANPPSHKNILRQTKTIRISTNLKFASIEF